MAKLTIVATIVANEKHLDFVKQALEKLIEPTLKEDGCIQYSMHQDNENPNRFLFYENWESKVQWEKHMENANLQEYRETTEGKVDDFTLYQMTET